MMPDWLLVIFLMPGFLGPVGYLLFLVLGGALFGQSAPRLWKRRSFAILASLVPALALAWFGSAFAVGFAREMDISWSDFMILVAMLAALFWPFSILGAFVTTRRPKQQSLP